MRPEHVLHAGGHDGVSNLRHADTDEILVDDGMEVRDQGDIYVCMFLCVYVYVCMYRKCDMLILMRFW